MRLQRLRFELGVELASEEVGMVGDLDDLDVGSVGGGAGNLQAGAGEQLLVFAIELVAVTMAFADLGGAVGTMGERSGLQFAGPRTEAHGSAEFFHAAQLAQLVDDTMRRLRIEFAGVGVLQSADVARELDAGGLHAQTDAEIRHLFLARIADSIQHAGNAALAEAAGNEDAVETLELRFVAAIVGAGGLKTFRLDPMNFELEVLRDGAVRQRFL